MPDSLSYVPTLPRVVTLVRLAQSGAALDGAAQRALLEATAPRYRSIPGLLRKFFLAGEGSGGGFYEWRSREAAEAWFTPEWRARMTAAYGIAPVLEWYEVPCLVDNEIGDVRVP